MSRPADDAPLPADLAGVFHVETVERDGETVRYVGDPVIPPGAVVAELDSMFDRYGYSLRLEPVQHGSPDGGPTRPARQRFELIAEPAETGHDGVPWLNVLLLLATVASTLYIGASTWYYIPVLETPLRIFEAWPFVLAMLGVLGVHELGHYAAARYHGVAASLPYFIPFPTLLGTLGAVINIRGHIPSRRALFDIGVAGPLAGLVATVVVTVVGFTLEPIAVPQRVAESGPGYSFRFQYPLLMQALAGLVDVLGWTATGVNSESVHPVAFAGWAGMFFTFLNLLPVGQLDGGHVVRAIVGPRQETVAAAVPGGLFALAGFLYLTRDAPPIGFGVWTLWLFWGLVATGLAYAGPARPTTDESLDRRRIGVGVATFLLGIACFTPVPFEIVAA